MTKFLKCVTWSDATEAKQAVELLSQWANIDVDDALELLGPNFHNRSVRSYAVKQLGRADDDDLLLYLLQLVQALKFEWRTTSSSSGSIISDEKNRAVLAEVTAPGVDLTEHSLAEFLIERAVRNPVLGNFFHWYLMVECEDKALGKMYAKVAYQFMKSMMELPSGAQRRDILRRQGELVAVLSNISKEVRGIKDGRPKKIEYLHAKISDPRNGLTSFPPLPLPLDATVHVTGIRPELVTVFKSSLAPLKITFTTVSGDDYPILFKTGDDLRQDQLVIQIITLMDKLLRKENLDLKLTAYRVLATGSDCGMLQFIPSQSLASILAENGGSLIQYLRTHNLDESTTATYSINPAVMEAYVKSCAGYCVITYLLGVGDRHLDNLLLSASGTW